MNEENRLALDQITEHLAAPDAGIIFLAYQGTPPKLVGVGGTISNPNGIAACLLEAALAVRPIDTPTTETQQ